jgi:hypothetical protein
VLIINAPHVVNVSVSQEIVHKMHAAQGGNNCSKIILDTLFLFVCA